MLPSVHSTQSGSSILALSRRPAELGEIHRRIDQAYVAERLGKIADQPFRLRIVFLGEQADVVAQAHEAFEGGLRLRRTAQERVIVRQPERASQERPLAGRQAIHSGIVLVTLDEAI